VVTATMSIGSRGDLTIELYPKAAPETVKRFSELVSTGFYNGVKVHKVDPGMIETGDPQSKTLPVRDPKVGTGGSGKTIPFENSKLPNLKGTLVMKTTGAATDTADSIFFINRTYNSGFDKDYCVFGRVVQGMDLIDKIQQ